jgi:hypothetical protein
MLDNICWNTVCLEEFEGKQTSFFCLLLQSFCSFHIKEMLYNLSLDFVMVYSF